MTVGDAAWKDQQAGFEKSRQLSTNLDLSRRRRDRTMPPLPVSSRFQNEPDTDFTLVENRAWLQKHLDTMARAPQKTIKSKTKNAKNATKPTEKAGMMAPQQYCMRSSMGSSSTASTSNSTASTSNCRDAGFVKV